MSGKLMQHKISCSHTTMLQNCKSVITRINLCQYYLDTNKALYIHRNNCFIYSTSDFVAKAAFVKFHAPTQYHLINLLLLTCQQTITCFHTHQTQSNIILKLTALELLHPIQLGALYKRNIHKYKRRTRKQLFVQLHEQATQ